MSAAVECVGFVECPCAGCRTARVQATDRHPDHAPGQAPYCGVCRTQRLQAYRA